MKRLSNRTKDKLAIIVFLIVIFGFITSLALLFIFFIENVAKADTKEIVLSEREQINKFYTEETIKNEMYYLSAWNTIESMSEEEYNETFYKEV